MSLNLYTGSYSLNLKAPEGTLRFVRSSVSATSFSSSTPHCHIQVSESKGKTGGGPLSSVERVGKCFVTGPMGCQARARSSLQTLFRQNWCQSASTTLRPQPFGQVLVPPEASKPPSLGLHFHTFLPSTRRLRGWMRHGNETKKEFRILQPCQQRHQYVCKFCSKTLRVLLLRP